MNSRFRMFSSVMVLCALFLAVLFIHRRTQAANALLNEFSYVMESSNQIQAFQLDVRGDYTPVAGSPFAAGDRPGSGASTPNGTYLYVPNLYDNNVSAYAITDGALGPLSGSPYPAGSGPAEAILSNNGLVFVSDCGPACGGSGSTVGISVYYAASGSGQLTQAPGSPFSGGLSQPIPLALDPSNQYLYVGDAETVAAFSIGKRGSLTPVPGSPYNIGGLSLGLAVNSSLDLLYVANSSLNNISVFSINPETGALSPIQGSPFTASGSPDGIAIDATNRFLYAAATDGVEGYAIGATGALTPLAGSPFGGAAAQNYSGMEIDRSNRFIYVGSFYTTLNLGFSINSSTGALTALPGSPFQLLASPTGGALSPKPR